MKCEVIKFVTATANSFQNNLRKFPSKNIELY